MNEPLITVITPTYNRGSILMERALPSVLNQTYENFIYIIVSDGSTDNTKELVRAIGDKRIQFYEIERNRPHHDYDSKQQWCVGGSYAANFALEKARGEWIARIDDDDVWHKDHLIKSLLFALENNFEFITSPSDAFGFRYIQKWLKIPDITKPDVKVGAHSSWFYRSYLKTMKYNVECYKKEWNQVEDVDLLERFYKKGIRIGYLDEVLTYITPRPGLQNVGVKAILEKKEMMEK